ncbi:enoyl-CoA hydratase/isomerase family protein [Caballeronia sp. 15715]|uniref:enoyl-CoA hydratase/isomerase family protein n=1 Tax=unclassified Caballeronia TaxID=2646786 RepID=UPI0039E4A7AA
MSTRSYFTKYSNFAIDRTDEGVLTVRFHTDGGPIVFTGETHRDFPALLEEIALDRDNKVMILTGTGDVFMEKLDGDSLGEVFKPAHWESTIRSEGIKVLQRLVDLPIPIIGVANGPATLHTEYLLLADIHIASETATYGDPAHPAFNLSAGDGVQVVWEESIGTARAKWLLWTGAVIDAATAEKWGVVSEVLPPAKVYARAQEIAKGLAARPPLYLALQKQTLNQRIRRRIIADVPYGMALEAMSAADLAYQATGAK